MGKKEQEIKAAGLSLSGKAECSTGSQERSSETREGTKSHRDPAHRGGPRSAAVSPPHFSLRLSSLPSVFHLPLFLLSRQSTTR